MQNSFAEVLAGIRRGDPVAIAEFVVCYQPQFMRVIRRRLRRHPQLAAAWREGVEKWVWKKIN